VEVVTDAAAVYPRVLDEVVPAVWHHIERWASNRIEADHSRLKQRLGPMRGLRTDRTATVLKPGWRFCRTSAADITNSPSIYRHRCGSRPRSPNWRVRSDNGSYRCRSLPGHPQCNGPSSRGSFSDDSLE
jgi:hypothetical protein